MNTLKLLNLKILLFLGTTMIADDLTAHHEYWML